MIDTQTKLTAVLGSPVSHSYSPAMHNAAFRALGMNCEYFPIECAPDALGDLLTGLRRMHFAGFNVTKPLKLEVMRYLDDLDASAREAGAVNTVKVDDGRLIGLNTDGDGFVDSLNEIQFPIAGRTFLILGAGGAARAVATALARHGAQVVIAARRPHTAETLAGDISGARACALGSAIAALAYDCIINASGAGMYPDLESTPADPSWFKKNTLACDLTYNPFQTRFLADAKAAGAATQNGLGMFLHQGARAFSIWFGIPAPVAVMRAAVETAVSGR